MSYGIALDVNSNDHDIKKYGTNEICPFSYLFTSSPTLSNLYDVRYVDFVSLSDSSNYSILETSVSKTLINKSNLIYADIDATRVSSIEPSGSQLSGVHAGTYERDDSASSFTSTCLSSIEFLPSLTIDEHIYVLCSETAPYLSTDY